MDPDIAKEVAALPRLSFADLRARYAELFHEPTRVGNRSWLVRRIAWRLQALSEGDLSDRARQYAAQIANDADLRTQLASDLGEMIRKLPHDVRADPEDVVLKAAIEGDTGSLITHAGRYLTARLSAEKV